MIKSFLNNRENQKLPQENVMLERITILNQGNGGPK